MSEKKPKMMKCPECRGRGNFTIHDVKTLDKIGNCKHCGGIGGIPKPIPKKLTAEEVLNPVPVNERYLHLTWPTGDTIIIDAKKRNIIVIGKGKRSVARCDVQDMFDPTVGIAVGIAMNTVKGERSWKRLKGMLNELVEKHLEILPVTVEDTLDSLIKKDSKAVIEWIEKLGIGFVRCQLCGIEMSDAEIDTGNKVCQGCYCEAVN